MSRIITAILLIIILSGCKSTKNHNNIDENVQKGSELFSNLGCVACHSVTGEKKYGPPLNDILNKNVEVIREGETLSFIIDAPYIKRSIQNPSFEKLTSFKNSKMPQPNISEEETNCLVDYIVHLNKTSK